MVRMVAAGGDGALMWPKNCTTLAECPNDLVMAVAHAHYILDSSANLMEDESPPHWKWAFPEEMEAHFERILRKRNEKFGNNSQPDEPPEGWAQNEYAEGIR